MATIEPPLVSEVLVSTILGAGAGLLGIAVALLALVPVLVEIKKQTDVDFLAGLRARAAMIILVRVDIAAIACLLISVLSAEVRLMSLSATWDRISGASAVVGFGLGLLILGCGAIWFALKAKVLFEGQE